ncbi:unnamed protein product [Lathyrus oleraceus]|uniref:RRM domain-containing protein n=1 Tax=Pisum sativum TaxID=3888 RepID=A0A9D5AGU2_PEA|nr:hypothetical protein KIW84_053482 [Pisum sativum]
MEPGQMEETGKLIALSYEEDDSEIDIQSEITYAKKCAELEFSELTEEEEAELLVGNLPLDVDNDKLATLFEQAGTVDSAKVIHKKTTDNQSLVGHGYVTMITVKEAESAIDKFNGYDYDGSLLSVNKANTRRSRPEQPRISEPVTKAYVGNLPWEVDNTKLEKNFSEHGKVVSA